MLSYSRETALQGAL